MSEKIKQFIAQYGKLGLYTHIGLSIGFFGLTYYLISRGIDVNHYLKKLNVDLSNKISPTTSHIALTYIIYKATMPMRIPVTIAVVPIVAKIMKVKKL